FCACPSSLLTEVYALSLHDALPIFRADCPDVRQLNRSFSMSRSKVDFWVGLFVLLGAVGLVFLALQAGNLTTYSFKPTYTVTAKDRKSTRLNSSHVKQPYAGFCLKK